MDKQFERYVNTMNVYIENLMPLTQSPFKVIDDKAMRDLIESIERFGILEPLTVRRTGVGRTIYEIISGYRRYEVCKRLGIQNIPVRVLDISKDDAIIAMIDANLCHREHILPSEKAAAYKMKLDAMKRQGYRSDLDEETTCTQPEYKPENSKSIQQLADESEDSREQIRRYIRLNNLIPEILELVDKGDIALTPAVELSYLTKEQQYSLFDSIEEEERTPSFSQAVRMKKTSQEGTLADDAIKNIMIEDKANQKPMFKVPMEKLQKFAPRANRQQLEDFVMNACEHYSKYLKKQRNREVR